VNDDFEQCYRAVASRDQRFDGWFFTAVTSTGIYCRPSCPATTPRRRNVRFLPTAAAAQQAGFRACRRCRPDAAPGSPEWNIRADVVARAMRLIADGVIDRKGVAGLAASLGYSERHLHRLLVAEVGVGPLALARTQRAATARILIETTAIPFSTVAFAAGFASVRQFNDTVQLVFGLNPTAMRRRAASASAPTASGVIGLRLAYRPPCDVGALLDHLAARAIPGVESASATSYRRTLRLPHAAGVVELTPAEGHVRCSLRLEDLRDLTAAVRRCRWLLDLDADPVAVDALLGHDEILGAVVRKRRGRRVPHTVDGAELAVRAVLGQQVSVAGARTLAGRLVQRYGKPLTAGDDSLTHLFPEPEALAGRDLTEIGIPASRAATLSRLTAALADGAVAGRRRRPRADDCPAAADPGHRRVDRRVRRYAGTGRSRRLPARGSGVAQRRGNHRYPPEHPSRCIRPLATVARLRRRISLVHTAEGTHVTATYIWAVPSPLGELTLLSDGSALTGLFMPSSKGKPPVEPDARRDAGPFRDVVAQLEAYFAGERTSFDLRLAPRGTPFQQQVWEALRGIPYGQTRSYRDIAQAIGAPKAMRAVGLANGRNPVSIVVPCHRVVGANGTLTGYGGGLANKQLLLDLEQRVGGQATLLDVLAD
jgi:AraC family transcriptional regulator of adaptative response / DNA-3-methyladenine glycosylase II